MSQRVELFFKWTKQHLRIKTCSMNENAVKSQSLDRYKHGPAGCDPQKGIWPGVKPSPDFTDFVSVHTVLSFASGPNDSPIISGNGLVVKKAERVLGVHNIDSAVLQRCSSLGIDSGLACWYNVRLPREQFVPLPRDFSSAYTSEGFCEKVFLWAFCVASTAIPDTTALLLKE
jgi:hypothetical protein